MGVMKRLHLEQVLGKPRYSPTFEAPEPILVASESDNDVAYAVTRHSSGRITCSCPHYVNVLSGKGQLCKHGIAFLQRMNNAGCSK